jgi:hypothetical protein
MESKSASTVYLLRIPHYTLTVLEISQLIRQIEEQMAFQDFGELRG